MRGLTRIVKILLATACSLFAVNDKHPVVSGEVCDFILNWVKERNRERENKRKKR